MLNRIYWIKEKSYDKMEVYVNESGESNMLSLEKRMVWIRNGQLLHSFLFFAALFIIRVAL